VVIEGNRPRSAGFLLRVVADKASGLGKAPEVVRADVVLMDVGFAIGAGRGLDGEPDVGSGIQLSDDVEARGLDDVLERAAGIDGSTYRASTDGQARDAVWSIGRQEQRGGGADVRTDNVRRTQAPFLDEARKERAHRIGCDQLRATV
jgi:hypothetical protein